jgi:hypothetical protein
LAFLQHKVIPSTFQARPISGKFTAPQIPWNFTESSEVTPAGIHFNTVISGFIPQDNVTLQEAIEYIEPRKWGVIFIDGNGNYKLAGNQTDPLRFTSEINTGKDTASLAGCSFQFSGKTKTRAMFVNKPF